MGFSFSLSVSPWADCQEEARTHQEQARPEERQEATKKIMVTMNSSRKTKQTTAKKTSITTNEEEHRGRFSGTSSASHSSAPVCWRKLKKCHIWLAPELLSVLSWGFLSCLIFPVFCFFCFFFYFVLECVARHRAALLGRFNFCGTFN